MINIGLNSFSKICLGNDELSIIYIGENQIYPNEQPKPTQYDYEVASSVNAATKSSDWLYAYDTKKVYALNKQNNYEPYGVYESVDSLDSVTTYDGKLVILGTSEYKFSSGSWQYVGEGSGGIGVVATISEGGGKISNFPINFQVRKSDIQDGLYFDFSFKNGNIRASYYEYGGGLYSIQDWALGDYQGTVTSDDEWVYFKCDTYPEETVDITSYTWWYSYSIDIYGNSIVYPVQYDKKQFDTLQGLYYDTEEEVPSIKGKGIVYNINGYMREYDLETDSFIQSNVNPYNLSYTNLSGNTSITKMKIEDEVVTTIGADTFNGCRSLTSVTIPNSVTSIGNNALRDCSSLTSVTIPNSVTSIANYVFANCTSLTSVTIPDSVTSLGIFALRDCSSLTSITIGSGVTSIGSGMFGGCNGLTNVTIPNSVTIIGDEAFQGCSGLTSITIGSGVTTIGSRVFSNCPNLQLMDFKTQNCPSYSGTSSTYTPFGYTRTSSYSGRTDYCGANVGAPVIKYPADGTNYNVNTYPYSWIALAAKSRTSTLSYKYNSSSSVTSRGYGFTLQAVLDGAYVDLTFADGTTRRDDLTSRTLGTQYRANTDIVGVEISSGVTSIGTSAFTNCTNLTSITIGSGVTSIGTYALRGCSSLTSVTIPNSVTSIGNNALRDCSSLTSVTIPNSVTSIGSSAFYGCSNVETLNYNASYPLNSTTMGGMRTAKLTAVTIGDNVTEIGDGTFVGCSSLPSITIPDSVTSIGSAFTDCSSLTEITIPNSVTSIRYNALNGTPWFSSYIADPQNIYEGIVYINNIAYYYLSGTNIVIRENTQTIGQRLLYRKNVTSVTMPNSVTTIDSEAFCQSSVRNINSTVDGEYIIPDGVKTIGGAVFYNVGYLKSIIIGNGVETIGGGAFQACYALKSVTIPDSVTSIGNKAFDGVSATGDLYCNYEWYSSLDETTKGYLYNLNNWAIHWIGMPNKSVIRTLTDGSTVVDTFDDGIVPSIKYTNNYDIVSVLISEGITTLEMGAFINCTNLTKVIMIGDTVTTVGDFVFQGCEKLDNIELSKNLTSISPTMFASCYALTSITIPDSVTTIDGNAFGYCRSLTNITIPSSVTTIGGYAFNNCTSLTSVTIPSSVTTIGDSAFADVPTSGKLYCSVLWYNALDTSMITNLGNVANWTKEYFEYKNYGITNEKFSTLTNPASVGDMFVIMAASDTTANRFLVPTTAASATLSASIVPSTTSDAIGNYVWHLEGTSEDNVYYIANENGQYWGWSSRSASVGLPLVAKENAIKIKIGKGYVDSDSQQYADNYAFQEQYSGSKYGLNNLYTNYNRYNWWTIPDVFTNNDGEKGSSVFYLYKVIKTA